LLIVSINNVAKLSISYQFWRIMRNFVAYFNKIYVIKRYEESTDGDDGGDGGDGLVGTDAGVSDG
jgi:hypothetical protein